MTYKDYLDGGGEKLFTTKDVGRVDGKPKHLCTCGGWDFAALMLDVRPFDIGDSFACGGCVSSWERNMVPIMEGDDFLIRHEWRASFIERRTGTKDPGAEEVKADYLEREIRRTLAQEARFTIDQNDHPIKIELTARRIALESRRI